MTLKGLRILNTRPETQGALLHETISALGGISIRLPLISIEPTTIDWLKHLPPLTHLTHAIFISTNAVTYFFKGLQQENMAWPKSIQITAIGQATAKALSKEGLDVHHRPSLANTEHLLQIPIFQNLNHQTVLVVKGVGGRTELITGLQSLGGQVISADVYKRVIPTVQRHVIDSLWQDDRVDIILLTSQEATHHLFSLFDEKAHPWLRQKPCVVISDRLAAVARSFGMQKVLVSAYDTVLKTISTINVNGGISNLLMTM